MASAAVAVRAVRVRPAASVNSRRPGGCARQFPPCRAVARAPSEASDTSEAASDTSEAASAAAQSAAPPGQPASPLVLSYPGPGGSTLYVGNDGPLDTDKPGNGGLRLMTYETEQDAIHECIKLTQGMSAKHGVFNTGFNGAKLVVHAPEGAGAIDKRALMEVTAEALNGLEGSVFTGQDLNTTTDDMDYLDSLCDFVLASMGSETDANVATAHGVFGAVQGVLQGHATDVAGRSFFVHGCGKVGGSLARQLVAAGASRVLTYDVFSEAADIPGCENVSASGADWAAKAAECDMLCPCAISWQITEQVVAALSAEGASTRFIVGAANLPFATPEARAAAAAEGILFVPESVASAGAVIVDSLECFDRPAYGAARPAEVYAFCQHLTREGARSISTDAQKQVVTPDTTAMNSLVRAHSEASGELLPAGARYRQWHGEAVEQVDTLVVGGGMAGTAAAMELAQLLPEGAKVEVLESRVVANDKGSSYGESRMYRRMYSDEFFSRMQADALGLWGELEERSGEQLLTTNGLLFYGETDTGETVEGSVPGARDVMARLGLEHEYFVGEELDARYPLLSSGKLDAAEGVLEHAAGSVNSSAACAAMAAEAAAAGVTVSEGERVADMWRPSAVDEGEKGDKGSEGSEGIMVATTSGRLLHAKKVVVAAGAWTNDVLKPLGVQLDLEVHNMHWGHWKVEAGADAANFPQWFCFRKERGEGAQLDGGLYYGFPAVTHDGETVVKVGVDWCPDTPKFKTSCMADFCFTPDEHVVKCINDFIAENWQGFGEMVDMQCSPYTMSRDQYFVLDTLEAAGYPEVSVFTAGNGRAFKFAPLIGRLLAELSTGAEQLSYDISPFSASREAVGLVRTEAAPRAAAKDVEVGDGLLAGISS